ncbi:MAG: SDR family oxidoreductase [Chloroflexi bacterium]|nr:SDR family oxidoreductase [Chloroflexota bacterium]
MIQDFSSFILHPSSLRLLVTGGSGYLGSAILKRAPRGWTLAATYLTQPLTAENVAAFRLDVRDAGQVDRVIAGWRPDVIVHTAAHQRGEQMRAVNADGSQHIASAAARENARLIHLSSDVIFDGEHAPYDESALPDPISPYAESKALAERAVVDAHPQPAIIRTSLIYGFAPLDPRTRQTLDGEMPRLFTDEYRCPILVDDLADALLELATSGYSGILNVAGPQRLSRYDFGVKLAHALGVEPRFAPALSAPTETSRPRDCTLDISRAQTLLRTRLRGVDQVLQSLISNL